VEIRNRTVSGFSFGINGGGTDHRISNIRAVNCTLNGIDLISLDNLVQDCTCSNNGQTGINVNTGTITGSVVCDNGITGIRLSNACSVIGNVAIRTATIRASEGFGLGTGNIVVDRNCASGNQDNYVGGPSNPAYCGINAGRRRSKALRYSCMPKCNLGTRVKAMIAVSSKVKSTKALPLGKALLRADLFCFPANFNLQSPEKEAKDEQEGHLGAMLRSARRSYALRGTCGFAH
jgi:hypothetical protein